MLEYENPPLDRRKAAILRAVVRDYVRTGQAVGSNRLLEKYRLRVSAATIRNDMGRLEEEGYLTQPYTSAGRIPTDKGYRWFVDNWPGPEWPHLNEPALKAIKNVLESGFKGLENTLDSTSHLLSTLTESAAVAVAPPSMKNALRQLELFRRDARRATLLLVARDGEVEQGVVEFGDDKTEDAMTNLARWLSIRLDGVPFDELASKIFSLPAVNADHLLIAEEIQRITALRATERVFRGGTANILSANKFPDISVAHEVVDALEHPPMLSALVEAARGAGTVLVFIGEEVPIEQMRACAVVFAPYAAGQGRIGTVGVIGPTRMNYPQTISAVEAVASSLSKMLQSVN